MAKLDLKGQVFERLTVIEEAGRNTKKEILWKCKCSCGNTTEVTTYRLRKGETKSCGCLNYDTDKRKTSEVGKANKVHGMSKTRVYKTYSGIKERCLNPNSKKYPDYGGRGITLSKEWDSFEKFHQWSIENGYDEELTLDRIDVNGNYEPNNCRWVDMKIQSNNKRNNRYVEYNGITKTLAEWAEHFGIKRVTLASRLDRQGLSFEEAISKEVKIGGHKKKKDKK